MGAGPASEEPVIRYPPFFFRRLLRSNVFCIIVLTNPAACAKSPASSSQNAVAVIVIASIILYGQDFRPGADTLHTHSQGGALGAHKVAHVDSAAFASAGHRNNIHCEGAPPAAVAARRPK